MRKHITDKLAIERRKQFYLASIITEGVLALAWYVLRRYYLLVLLKVTGVDKLYCACQKVIESDIFLGKHNQLIYIGIELNLNWVLCCLLFGTGSLVECSSLKIKYIDSQSNHPQLPDVKHSNKSRNLYMITQLDSLYTFAAANIPQLYFPLIVCAYNHRCILNWSKGCYHGLMTDETCFYRNIEKTRIYLQNIDFCLVATGQKHLIGA